MAASPRQPGMLEGLSRFLVQHERCGAGFDVAHPAGLGSGRVSITCRGCGARHEYATATIEAEREVPVEPAPPREPELPAPRRQPTRDRDPQRPARRIPPRPAPYPDAGRTAEEAEAIPAEGTKSAEEILRAHLAKAEGAEQRRGARTAPAPVGRPPSRAAGAGRVLRSPAVTFTILILAAAALGFGVVRLINGDDGADDGASQTAAAPPPAAAPEPAGQPPAGPVPSPVPGTPQPAITTLRTERFTVDVPRSWSRRTVEGGLLLQPRGGGRVNVRIFYELSPELSAGQMAAQTRGFLARLVPGARLLPNETEIAGEPSYELTARGPGETAIAVNVLRGPYRYLLVRRIFAGAKPPSSEAASRIVRSFRPR